MLFTVTTKEERFKAKSFIDTVIYRGGDVVSGWMYAALQGVGLALTSIAFVAIPLCAIWAAIGYVVGRKHAKVAASVDAAPAAN